MASVITNKGTALLAKLTQGKALEITCAKTGAGTVDATLLKQQTGVTNQKQTMTINGIRYPENGKCALVLSITNAGVASAYSIMQIGIFANDPDEGEVLFSIWQIDSGSGINVPSETVIPGYNAELNYNIKYDQADSVNVNVDPSNTVSQAAMEAYVNSEVKVVVNQHTTDKNNPHNVTADQIKNGTLDADRLPVVPVDKGGTGASTASQARTNLGAASSDSLSLLTTMFANHEKNQDNPHGVTPGQIGAVTSAAMVSYVDSTVDTIVHQHASKQNNPHNVTAEQVGTVPTGDIPNLHIWEKHSADPKGYTETSVSAAVVGSNTSGLAQVWYSSEISIVDGQFSSEGFELLSSSAIADFNVLKGKYVRTGYVSPGYSYYRIPEDAVLSKVSSGVDIRPAISLSANNSELLGYVAGKANNTYPTNGAHSDGYWYRYIGQLGEVPYSYGTRDLAAGVSPLATGKLYFVYE